MILPLLVAGVAFLLLASDSKKHGADPGGLTRLAPDGKHNQWTEAGRAMAWDRMENLTIGPSPSWLTDVNNKKRAVVTLVPRKPDQNKANNWIKELLNLAPPGTTIWTDATFTELAFTDSDSPPLDLLSAKFNLLTKLAWGWPVPAGKLGVG